MNSSSVDNICSLQNASRIYGTRNVPIHALRNACLDIRHGEFVGILGPSGCGKSTLLSVLGLLERLDEGAYFLGGQDTSRMGFDQRALLRGRNIGWVFQTFNLLSDLTVFENIALPLRYGPVPRSEHRERVRAIMSQVGLSQKGDAYPNQLSGGEQQRTAIARAMVTRPALVLADEPTGNLDSQNAETVIELLNEINRLGAAVVLVTHDDTRTGEATRIVRLRDGVIVDDHAR